MAEQKWVETTHRWCQTNLTEIDAAVCDIDFWKRYWRENHIQGIIVNAGGIVAYYPSRFPLQYRSRYLGDRDLLREFTDAAREMGLRVVARMDINRATQEFVDARPRAVCRGRPVPLLRKLRLLHGIHSAAAAGDTDRLSSGWNHGQLLAGPVRQTDLLLRYLP